MTNNSESTRKEKYTEMLNHKEQQKKFVENHLKEIYDVESRFLNQVTRNEAQKDIRQIILKNLPKDIEGLKKINEESKNNAA
jgi:hypothetical protein